MNKTGEAGRIKMEIKIQFFGRVYALCVGYKTKWFGQMSFITLTEEVMDEKGEVGFAYSIFRS